MDQDASPQRFCIRLVFAGLFFLAATALAVSGSSPSKPITCVLPIHSDINPGTSSFVRRAVMQAETRGARALVIDINTFGGRVDSATEIGDVLVHTSVPTIAYVNPRAISAGSLIALSCKSIVMADASTIGAATPVMIGPGMAQPQPTSEKEVSYMREEFRAKAEHNGYPPLLAEAMVDPDLAVGVRFVNGTPELFKIEEPAVPEQSRPESKPEQPHTGMPIKLSSYQPNRTFGASIWPAVSVTEINPDNIVIDRGKLLTLSKERAIEWGLTDLTATSLDDLLKLFDLDNTTVVYLDMSWSEKLAGFLTNPILASLLLTFGFLGIFYELKMPGWGVSGTFGIVCLALFFGANYLTGLASWFEVILFIIGLVLLAAEILVIPGFGIAGISGITCLLLSLYMALVKQPIPQYSWDVSAAYNALWTLVMWGVLLVVAIVLSWKAIERTPLYAAIVQVHEERADRGFTMPTADLRDLVGREGVACSILRPTGRARIDGQTVNVVTQSEFLPKGARIRVTEVEGNRIVVVATETNEPSETTERT